MRKNCYSKYHELRVNEVQTSEVLVHILSQIVCDCRQGEKWWMDLLTTYTHNSELEVITALSLISALYKSPQHPLSLFPASYILISCSLATDSNSANSSASHASGSIFTAYLAEINS
jgi:hypothetical protein